MRANFGVSPANSIPHSWGEVAHRYILAQLTLGSAQLTIYPTPGERFLTGIYTSPANFGVSPANSIPHSWGEVAHRYIN